MNQFVVHSSLDIVEEVQWISNTMYVSFPPPTKPRKPTSISWLLLFGAPFLFDNILVKRNRWPYLIVGGIGT